MYIAERNFAQIANSQLAVLAANDTQEPSAITHALTQLKQHALPVKARAIFRAALLCEDVLKRCTTPMHPKYQAALSSLMSVTELYIQGLIEIDPDFEEIVSNTKAQSNDSIFVENLDYQLESAKISHNHAASTLRPLLKLVKNPDRISALSFLADYTDQTGIGQNGHNPKAIPTKLGSIDLSFENLMQELSNQILAVARMSGKNISVSYGADFEGVARATAKRLKEALEIICNEIVREGLIINGDLAASMQRTWQISITGKSQALAHLFIIDWNGQPLTNDQLALLANTISDHVEGDLCAQHVDQNTASLMGTQRLLFTCPQHVSTRDRRLVESHTPKIRKG